MTKDIVPELLEKLENEFVNKYSKNKKINSAVKKIKTGKATHKDSNEFAYECGKILAEVFKENISTEDLPDGKMYYNIADRVLNNTLGRNYKLISDYSADVQTSLNKSAGLKIKGLKPPKNQDRINGLIEKVQEKTYEETKWVLQEPIINFSQSIIDDTIKTNVDFHNKLGLRPKIVRKMNGNCCDWCKEVEGEYKYPNVPKDVFRRHRFCRCTVEYFPGDGRKQNVHTKKWQDINAEEKIDARKKTTSEISATNELVKRCKEENIDYNPVKRAQKEKTENDIINRLGGGDKTSGSCSSLAFAYIGNKAGYDVLDFRGGDSCKFFATNSNIQKIADLKNVKSYVEKHTSDFKAVNNLLSHIEQGKEYYLATGRHAAIIRKTENGMEFLELQSPETEGYPLNGFLPLTDKSLRKRFGCKRSHSSFGIKLEAQSTLIDIESLYESDEFKDILGFINTKGKNQMKGVGGSVK